MTEPLTSKDCPARGAHRWVGTVAAIVLSATACQGGATPPGPFPSTPIRAHNTVADWPLTFVQHNFGAFCYSVYECQVSYGGYSKTEREEERILSSEHLGDRYPENMRGGYLGIMNFPAPAQVRWRSKDGTLHEATVDIGDIFSDRLILHDVPRHDIPQGVSILNPEIILEVNDRTINVYMRALIPTISLRTPGNPNSDYRRDLKLAWSATL